MARSEAATGRAACRQNNEFFCSRALHASRLGWPRCWQTHREICAIVMSLRRAWFFSLQGDERGMLARATDWWSSLGWYQSDDTTHCPSISPSHASRLPSRLPSLFWPSVDSEPSAHTSSQACSGAFQGLQSRPVSHSSSVLLTWHLAQQRFTTLPVG